MKDMKARVKLDEYGRYLVEWKTGWFWHSYNDTGIAQLINEYGSVYYFDDKDSATDAMIHMVRRYEDIIIRKKNAKTFTEFSSEDLRERFAEYYL